MHAQPSAMPLAPVRMCLYAATLAVVLLPAGCADLNWEKPGTDTSAHDQDLLQCTQQARLDARREETPGLDSALVFRADPSGRPVVVPNAARDDRYLVEQDYISTCMRGKGYVLTPKQQS